MSPRKAEPTLFVSRRGFLGAGMGVAGLAALAACSGGTSSGTSTGTSGGSAYGIPKASASFVHERPTDVISLDPANTLGDSDQEISHNIYERLLAPKWKPEDSTGQLIWDGLEGSPQLAQSWKVDGPVITFHLRTDVKFYPTGNPLTAEDVRYSFERLTKIVGNGQRLGVVFNFNHESFPGFVLDAIAGESNEEQSAYTTKIDKLDLSKFINLEPFTEFDRQLIPSLRAKTKGIHHIRFFLAVTAGILS